MKIEELKLQYNPAIRHIVDGANCERVKAYVTALEAEYERLKAANWVVVCEEDGQTYDVLGQFDLATATVVATDLASLPGNPNHVYGIRSLNPYRPPSGVPIQELSKESP